MITTKKIEKDEKYHWNQITFLNLGTMELNYHNMKLSKSFIS